MNDKLEKMEGSGCGLIDVLSWYLPGGDEESHENSVRVASVLAKI
jgi:hypothetical protein